MTATLCNIAVSVNNVACATSTVYTEYPHNIVQNIDWLHTYICCNCAQLYSELSKFIYYSRPSGYLTTPYILFDFKNYSDNYKYNSGNL